MEDGRMIWAYSDLEHIDASEAINIGVIAISLESPLA